MEGGRLRHLGALAALALMAALGGAGCGSEPDDSSDARPTAPVLGQGLPPEVRHPITAAVERLQRAFLDEDYEDLCAGVTPAAARAAGRAAHGSATTCERDIRRLFGLIRKGGGWRHAGAPLVTDVQVDGDEATATVALDRRWQAHIPLARDGGRWRLSGLFGSSAAGRERQAARAIPDADFPPPGPQPVEILDAEGAPCPDLSEDRYPFPSGGCRIDMSTPTVPLTILAPFGDFEFERCLMAFRVRADAAGRTWTEGFDVRAHPSRLRERNACGDVNTCYDYGRQQLVPWRGRIYPEGDGRFLHRVDMCLRTCVGWFVGELKVRLWQEDGSWRAEPVDGGGDTGFRFVGPLRIEGDFDIETDA